MKAPQRQFPGSIIITRPPTLRHLCISASALLGFLMWWKLLRRKKFETLWFSNGIDSAEKHRSQFLRGIMSEVIAEGIISLIKPAPEPNSRFKPGIIEDSCRN